MIFADANPRCLFLRATYVDCKVSAVKQIMAVFVSTEMHPMASMRVDHIPTPSAISGSGLLMRDTIL